MFPNYGYDFLDPNAYSQYGGTLPQNPGVQPSQFAQFMWNLGQYGVSAISPLAGTALSLLGNFGAQWYQNKKQEKYFERYMSPTARMAQMKAAGINPNAAAQGISGSSAPQMTAAAPTSAFTGVGEQLGQSVNSALTADAIKASIGKTNAEKELTESLNTGKNIENKYADAMQNAALRNLINQGAISEHQANIIAVDDYYHGAEAAAHLEQSYMAIEKMAAELQNEQQSYFNLLAQEYATMQAGALSEAQIHKVFSDIGLTNAQIDKIAHETSNIDASTMSIMQNISESQARERLTRVQAQYQEKVLATWNDSGWNMNSDVNCNFQRLCLEGKYNEAKNILQGTEAMILNEGKATNMRKDKNFDRLISVVGMATSLSRPYGRK